MIDFEALRCEDVFVADALSDVALRALQPNGPNRLRAAAARLFSGGARALRRAERKAARKDVGVRPRVSAPASLRVPKRPLPADQRFFPPDPVASPPHGHALGNGPPRWRVRSVRDSSGVSNEE